MALVDKKGEKVSPKEMAQIAVAQLLNSQILNWTSDLKAAGFAIKPTDKEIEKTEEQMEKILVRIFKMLKQEMNIGDEKAESDEMSNQEDEDDEVSNEDLEEVLEEKEVKKAKTKPEPKKAEVKTKTVAKKKGKK